MLKSILIEKERKIKEKSRANNLRNNGKTIPTNPNIAIVGSSLLAKWSCAKTPIVTRNGFIALVYKRKSYLRNGSVKIVKLSKLTDSLIFTIFIDKSPYLAYYHSYKSDRSRSSVG